MTPNVFRLMRQQLKLTQQALALELGVHRNSVGRWEREGAVVPPLAARAMTALLTLSGKSSV